MFYIIQKETLDDIGNALREKYGDSQTYNAAQVADAIRAIASVPDGSSVTFGNQNGAPVERLEAYAIASEDLNALAAITQTMAGKSALMNVDDMIYWLNRVQHIPQGNAESGNFAGTYASSANGVLPEVQIGTATSMCKSVFSSATDGILIESEEV